MATTTPASPVGAWAPSSPTPVRGTWSRIVAAALHVGAGFLLAATALGVILAQRILHGGAFVVNPSDLATLDAVAPVFVLVAGLGLGHMAAGLGTLLGSRAAALAAVGLGVVDGAVGVALLAVAENYARHRADGVGIALAFVAMGMVLAFAAGVAWLRTRENGVDA